jgi:hypothetical protein
MYGKKGIAFALLHNLRVKLGVLDISNGLGTGYLPWALLHCVMIM